MEADQIKKVNIEYSTAEIEDKTILFIENYYCGARGIISKIFYEYLYNPLYSDYKLVWLVRDYNEAVSKFGGRLEDGRVWLCIINGYDYVRYLNTARYIYTADYLPNFYQKREGQIVFYAPIDYILARKHYTNAMLWKHWKTVNAADHIVTEENTPGIEKVTGKADYENVIKVFDTKEEFYIKSSKTVFVSLVGERDGINNKNSFYYIYSLFTALADAYDYDIHWRVSLALYKKLISDESIYESLKNVHSTEEAVSSLFKNADIIITDNMCDLVSANKNCKKVILFTNQISEIEDISCKNDFLVVSDFEVLSDIYEALLSGSEIISCKKEYNKGTELPDCPSELMGEKDYKTVKGNISSLSCEVINSEASHEKARILLLVETCGLNDFLYGLNESLKKYKDKVFLTVLYRGSWNTTLYDRIADIDTDIPYICRSGEIQCEDEFKEEIIKTNCAGKSWTKEVVQNEWKRILGRTDFDYAIGIRGVNVFWNNMYEYVPASKFDLYEKKESASDMIDEIENLLKTYTDKNI